MLEDEVVRDSFSFEERRKMPMASPLKQQPATKYNA